MKKKRSYIGLGVFVLFAKALAWTRVHIIVIPLEDMTIVHVHDATVNATSMRKMTKRHSTTRTYHPQNDSVDPDTSTPSLPTPEAQRSPSILASNANHFVFKESYLLL